MKYIVKYLVLLPLLVIMTLFDYIRLSIGYILYIIWHLKRPLNWFQTKTFVWEEGEYKFYKNPFDELIDIIKNG